MTFYTYQDYSATAVKRNRNRFRAGRVCSINGLQCDADERCNHCNVPIIAAIKGELKE